MQINIYKDKMLGARLFGASVLYSAAPIPREDVPQGWYCYDLRGTARHPDEPHALVDLAEENHAGSILSYLPLKKSGSQFRLVKDMFQMTGTVEHKPFKTLGVAQDRQVDAPFLIQYLVDLIPMAVHFGKFHSRVRRENAVNGHPGLQHKQEHGRRVLAP